jgi:ketosteroid isomerase-like protein
VDFRESGVVGRYLTAIVEHDWDALGACVAEDIVRVGPFGDTYTPKAPYIEFISALMPTLEKYSMRVDRIVYAEDRTFAVAELTEELELGGTPYLTPEALLFGIGPDGLIQKIDIYIKRLA